MCVLFYLLLVGVFFFWLMPCIFSCASRSPWNILHSYAFGSTSISPTIPCQAISHWENNLTRKKKYIPNQLFYVLNFDVGTKTDFWPNGIAMYSVFSFLCLPVCFVYCLSFVCSLLPHHGVLLIFNLNVSAFLYAFVCLSFFVCVCVCNRQK